MQINATRAGSNRSFNNKAALGVHNHALAGIDRLCKREVLTARNVKVKSLNVALGQRQALDLRKPQGRPARTDRSSLANGNREALSRNHTLRKRSVCFGHLNTGIGRKHHLSITCGRQHAHDAIGLGHVHALLRGKRKPPISARHIDLKSPLGRAESARAAAKRHGAARKNRIICCGKDALLARQPQGALRRHHADGNRLVACHKDIARRLRVNARILAGELDADRTLERYGHGLVVGIPDDVAHIGSREHLVGLKPL